MTKDEAFRRLADKLNRIDSRLEDNKAERKQLNDSREKTIDKLRTLAAGGGLQEDLFEEDDDAGL